MAYGFANVTGGVTYPAGYWLAAPAGSDLAGIPRAFREQAGRDWLDYVAAEREAWYASLPSGAPPEWNRRGMASAHAARAGAGGAWSGPANAVQALVSTELAEYWTNVAPRMNRAEYIAARWAEQDDTPTETIDAGAWLASAPYMWENR